jgi:hypothetical protein
MPANETDLVRLLPYILQDKVHYYFDFIKDRLFEIAIVENRTEMARRFEKDVELIFFMRLLYGYFVLGYQNYDSSLQFFEAFDVDGFQIGTTHYSRNSSVTQEWHDIATGLETIIQENEIERYMRPTISTDEIIKELLIRFDDESGENHG